MALEQFKRDGQAAIVTGAGRSVGEGIAKEIEEAGGKGLLTPLHRIGNFADLGRPKPSLCTRDCYATNSTFIVDGGLQGPNSSLPIPDL